MARSFARAAPPPPGLRHSRSKHSSQPGATMKVTLCCMLLTSAVTVSASRQKATNNNLAKYLERVQLAETSVPTHTLGSAWSDNGRMASLTSDYKARSAGD